MWSFARTILGLELQFHCPEIHDKHWRPMPVMRQVLNGHQRLDRIRMERVEDAEAS